MQAERIRDCLVRLGPTFVKFGQMLSIRPDLIPPEASQKESTVSAYGDLPGYLADMSHGDLNLLTPYFPSHPSHAHTTARTTRQRTPPF